MRRVIILLLVLVASLPFIIGGCVSEPTAEEKDRAAQNAGYEHLVNTQPVGGMEYSPTREGLNFFQETWEEPGKLSYVYMTNTNGNLTGYYIFEGLPISYCASATPTEKVKWSVEGVPAVTTAPALDGAYYSGSGCTQYFGKDATTGSYIEFTAGGSQNYTLYDQPLPRQDVEPLGFTEIKDIENGEVKTD